MAIDTTSFGCKINIESDLDLSYTLLPHKLCGTHFLVKVNRWCNIFDIIDIS